MVSDYYTPNQINRYYHNNLRNMRNILVLFLLCFTLSSSAQVMSISSYSKRVYNNKENSDVWSDFRTTSVLNFYNNKKWEIITNGKKYVYYITKQETYNDGWGTNAKFVCTGENGYRYDIDLHWLLDRYIFEITSPWRKVLYYISEEDFNNARNAYLE